MEQRYVSDELVHCVGQALPTDDLKYELLVRIIREGVLRRPPREGFNGYFLQMYADVCDNDLLDSQIVCFCDIPLPQLAIHLAKYSNFGLAFSKAFLIPLGANPVYYIACPSMVPENVWPRSEPIIRSSTYRDPYYSRPGVPTPITRCNYFNALARLYNSEYTYRFAITSEPDKQSNEFQRVADLNNFFTFQFLAFLKFFDPELADDDRANYYMEREWRVLGDVSFQLNDIARILVPSGYDDRLRGDLPEYRGAVYII